MNDHITKSGAELIALERQRQIEKENWSPEHDDEHVNGEMVYAAICYAVNKSAVRQSDDDVSVDIGDKVPVNLRYAYGFFGPRIVVDWKKPAWPWTEEWDKREDKDRIRSLVIAASLLAAEIDRLQRIEVKKEKIGG